MNFHDLNSNPTLSYGPEALKVLSEAFDGAWQSVAGNFGDDAAKVEAARRTLASIILSLPQSETADVEWIKNAALRVMAVGYRDQHRPVS